ncbi:M4 family metallopeptidase, partial [Deinococcus sp. GbtcB9]|uniref:M4 family metallopeptidase n=1 Tax=Deinococcus sp. GbtcB9 TaxID=2824754 RepID=UPI001C2F5316
QAIGGNAWEGAGLAWYRALTADLSSTAGFTEFAEKTITAAAEIGSTVESAVRDAWTAVGVIDGARDRERR